MHTKKNGAAALFEDSFPYQHIYLQYLFVVEIKHDIHVLSLIGISIGVRGLEKLPSVGQVWIFSGTTRSSANGLEQNSTKGRSTGSDMPLMNVSFLSIHRISGPLSPSLLCLCLVFLY